MSAVTRNTGAGTGAAVAVLIALFAAIGAASVWTIAQWMSTGRVEFVNPVAGVMGREPWTATHTAAAIAVAVVVLVVIVVAVVVAVRKSRDRSPADRAAPYMGRGRSIAPLLPGALAKKHKRMGLDVRRFRGVLVGYAVIGATALRASYEDTITVIAGPRRNKSVSIVIPAIVEAPGSLLVTGNKPDLMVTAGHRATMGRVSLFDPQGLAAAHTDNRCWWNPLATVRTIEDAAVLADVFAAASYDAEKKDDFFAKSGRDLVANYLFAAAVNGNYLSVVFDWLSRPDNPMPARVLQERYPALADDIESTQALVEETRSGVYGFAQGVMRFMASESLRACVTPTAGLTEFKPEEFSAAPSDTLYLLSEEGPASAGPLVAALTRAVLTAAENDAKREPSGRRPVPFMAVLDEAGNICRIPDLPAKYTHYGSRGIVVTTILQSQEQGEQVWSPRGFAQLWGASTIQVFGGGNASNGFLRDLSERIGDYEYTETTTNHQNGQRNVNRTRSSDRIMSIADLASLSLGRMVVLASGCRPVLVKSVPWFKDKQMRRLINGGNQAPVQVHRTATTGVEVER